MNNITIRQRILLSFAVIIAVMLLMGGIALQRLFSIDKDVRRMQVDSIPGMYIASQMEAALPTYYATISALAIADRSEMAQMEDRLRVLRSAFETAFNRYESTIVSAEDRQNYEALKTHSAALFALQPEATRLGGSDPVAMRQLLRNRVDPAFIKAEAAIEKISEYNDLLRCRRASTSTPRYGPPKSELP